MKNNTANLKLVNPATGEFDWDLAWWQNNEILDSFPGVKALSSAELPAEPWTGQLVFLWDSSSLLAWNGQCWLDLTSGAFLKLKCGDGEILRGRLVALDEGDRVVSAEGETPALRILGIAVASALPGEKVLVKTRGRVRAPEFDLEAGQVYYAGPEGELSAEAQAGQEPVGIALAVDVLLLRI